MIEDPVVWYTTCARLDGVDPTSDDPIERLKFQVYIKRMNNEALRTTALLMPHVSPDKAPAAAKAYLEAVMPISEDAVLRERFRNEQKGKAVESLGIFSSGSIRRATPGSASWTLAEDKLGSPIEAPTKQEAWARGSFAPRRR